MSRPSRRSHASLQDRVDVEFFGIVALWCGRGGAGGGGVVVVIVVVMVSVGGLRGACCGFL